MALVPWRSSRCTFAKGDHEILVDHTGRSEKIKGGAGPSNFHHGVTVSELLALWMNSPINIFPKGESQRQVTPVKSGNFVGVIETCGTNLPLCGSSYIQFIDLDFYQ
jgi:hypothetical protein